jgi:hypothetical protein
VSTLTDSQVRGAALSAVDDYLDVSLDSQWIKGSTDELFRDGWSEDVTGEGDIEDVELNPDAEDYAAIHEEANSILRFLRDRTDLYYD